MVLIYRWIDNATARIRDENEKSVVEILSRGTQIVIPPSIHPDTRKPYWSNVELLDILKDVPVLAPGCRCPDPWCPGRLRREGLEADQDHHDEVRASRVPGQCHGVDGWPVRHGCLEGELTLLEALGRIQAWVENLTEKVVGDSMTVEKAQQKLIEFLVADVIGEKRKTLPVGWDQGLSLDDKKKMGVDFTEEQTEWSYDKIKTYLDELLVHTRDFKDVGFKNSVEFVLNRMAYASETVGDGARPAVAHDR